MSGLIEPSQIIIHLMVTKPHAFFWESERGHRKSDSVGINISDAMALQKAHGDSGGLLDQSLRTNVLEGSWEDEERQKQHRNPTAASGERSGLAWAAKNLLCPVQQPGATLGNCSAFLQWGSQETQAGRWLVGKLVISSLGDVNAKMRSD